MTSLRAKRNVPYSQVLPYLSLLHPALCEVLLFQLVPLQVGWKCILESESVKKLKFHLASMRWFLCCNLMSYFLLQRWQSNLCSPCSSITLCLMIIIKMQMMRTIPKGRLAKMLMTISDIHESWRGGHVATSGWKEAVWLFRWPLWRKASLQPGAGHLEFKSKNTCLTCAL